MMKIHTRLQILMLYCTPNAWSPEVVTRTGGRGVEEERGGVVTSVELAWTTSSFKKERMGPQRSLDVIN